MAKMIRLTESQLIKVIKRIIKEDEEEWISQAQDMEDESDFTKMDLKRNKDFQRLVSFFEENPDIAQEIEDAMEENISESHKYYDYSGDRGKKEITRNQYLKRKLINYGIWGTLGAIVGYTMGIMSGDDVLQAALMMAGMGGTVGAELSGTVGRERIKEDEEWGETDKGEEGLQDLIEEARDILENELNYDLHDINLMSERDIVDVLFDEGYEDIASEIEELLDKEGF